MWDGNKKLCPEFTKDKMPMQKNVKTIMKLLRSHLIFCLSTCSVHGFGHLVRGRGINIEKILWLALIIAAGVISILLSFEVWLHFQSRPTVISLERDYWKWNSTFPAVTICQDDIKDHQLKYVASQLNITDAEELKEFRIFVEDLVFGNYNYYSAYEKYLNCTTEYIKNTEMYITFALNFTRAMEDSEITQSFGQTDTFQRVFTEHGLCNTYNSKIAIYNTPEYWENNSNILLGFNKVIEFNPNTPDRSVTLKNLRTGYKVFFHAPNEVIDIGTKGFHVNSLTFTEISLSIQSVRTSEDIRELGTSQRNCLFTDESNLEHSPVYSYNLCRVECRIKLCLEFCSCTPFYYRRFGNEEICNMSGMYCLSKYADILTHLYDATTRQNLCACTQNCEIDLVQVDEFNKQDWFLLTHLTWTVKSPPQVRYKRRLIFSKADLLVQIGGIVSLFLGCSVLSLTEIIYFLTIRLYWGVVKGRSI